MQTRDNLMNKDNKGDYIALREAARVYNYTRDHLGYLIRKGDLRGEKLGSFFFTTHDWMKDYVANSGKSRKISSHKVQVSEVTPQDNTYKRDEIKVAQRKKRLKISFLKRALKATKRDLGPLVKDIGNVSKRIIKTTKSIKSPKINLFLVIELKKEVFSWKQETKYWIKKTKKRLLRKELQTLVSFTRKTVSNTILLPSVLLEKLYSLVYKTRNLTQGFLSPSRFLRRMSEGSSKKFQTLLNRALRNISWSFSGDVFKLSVGARKKLSKTKRTKTYGASMAVIGLLIMLIGANSLALNFGQKVERALIISLNKVSEPVYEAYESIIPENSQKGPSTNLIVFREIRGGKQSFNKSSINLTKDIEPLIAIVKTEIVNTTLKINDNLATVAENINIQKLTNDLSEIKRIMTKKVNKILIAMGDMGKTARENSKRVMTSANMALKGKIDYQRKAIVNWQNRNNVFLARLESQVIEEGSDKIDIINNKASDQLASLKDGLEFLIRPFREIGQFLAFGGTNNTSQTRNLEERISRLESEVETKNQFIDYENESSQIIEGVIAIPSTENDAENKEKIRNTFSDEINIIPDKTGRSGIIQPIFRKETSQKYLYMLLPAK